jgi:hypothetical protein
MVMYFLREVDLWLAHCAYKIHRDCKRFTDRLQLHHPFPFANRYGRT